MRLVRRTCLSLLAVIAGLTPGVATAQDPCRTIRAITNADGRDFADLEIRIARPFATIIRAAPGEALPAPGDCSLSAETDSVDLSCTWRPGDHAAATALYDSLFSRLQECLAGGLASPSGPSPYGGSVALRRSTTTISVPGGETDVSLALIESGEAHGIPTYHYVSLTVNYLPAQATD